MSDLVPLAQAHCIPRRGVEHRLPEARLRELLPELPEWELAENGHALVRTFRFDEIAALPPGWAVRDIHPLRVPGLDAERHLVVVGRTPPQGA